MNPANSKPACRPIEARRGRARMRLSSYCAILNRLAVAAKSSLALARFVTNLSFAANPRSNSGDVLQKHSLHESAKIYLSSLCHSSFATKSRKCLLLEHFE